jgi:hypothetical protein
MTIHSEESARDQCSPRRWGSGGLGWISLGGTAAHIALMYDFLVEKKEMDQQ